MRQIDLGHDGDHLAVGLDMVWDRDCRSHHIRTTNRRQTFNRDNIKSHDGLRAELCSTEVAPWEQNVETQIHDLNTAITGALERHCPKPHVTAKKPFLDKEIMALRQQKNALRQRQNESWKHHRRSLLYRVFAAWRIKHDSHSLPDAFDIQLLCWNPTTWCSLLLHHTEDQAASTPSQEKLRRTDCQRHPRECVQLANPSPTPTHHWNLQQQEKER